MQKRKSGAVQSRPLLGQAPRPPRFHFQILLSPWVCLAGCEEIITCPQNIFTLRDYFRSDVEGCSARETLETS